MITDNFISIVWPSSVACHLGLRARVYSRGYVNRSRGWICRRLASAVGCGVAIAAADPATSWDDSCNPPGDRCCDRTAQNNSVLSSKPVHVAIKQ
jgi:hypothetical protein